MTSNTTTTSSARRSSSSIKRQFLLIAAIIGGMAIYYISDFLSLNVKVTYNDDGCQLIAGIGPGSEDIVVIDNNLALVSAGDIDRQFFKSGNDPRDGGIFAIHFKDDDDDDDDEQQLSKQNINDNVVVEKIILEGFPSNDVLNAHGISYSNKTQRVYAVSHDCGKRSSESIEIFKLVRHNNTSLTLVHEYSLKSPSHFPHGTLNDVIEGASLGELYVTQWIATPINDQCVGHDGIVHEMKTMINALFRRLTKVHRCTWDTTSKEEEPHCHAVAEGFKMANGITANPERTKVFVTDTLGRQLHVFARQEDGDGALIPQDVIKLNHDLDNVEYDVSSNKLTLSASPLKYQSLMRSKLGSGVTVGGGMVTVQQQQQQDPSSKTNGTYVVDEVLMHDGSKLSMISSAVFWHGRVLLGSPVSDGVLMCPIPQGRA